MKVATAHLKSASPYSQSRAHETEKLPRETADAFEQRTWREKCHVTDEGFIFIPPMSFKQGLDTAAKMLGRQIPGKGKSTYTKFFASGVLCTDRIVLPVKRDAEGASHAIRGERVHCNADGVRGSGKRVWRTFPVVDEWLAQVAFHVLADEITKDVFEDHLKQAGAFVGIGRFRPQNGGFYGRYQVEKVVWQEI